MIRERMHKTEGDKRRSGSSPLLLIYYMCLCPVYMQRIKKKHARTANLLCHFIDHFLRYKEFYYSSISKIRSTSSITPSIRLLDFLGNQPT